MNIAVVKETYPGERRVALVPLSIAALVKLGCHVQVEAGAGQAACYPDDAYREHGAEIVADRGQLFQAADIVAQVRALGANPAAGQADLELVRDGLAIVGTCDPLGNPAAVQQLAERGVTLFAMELIPRITRAQSMDVLSSMATISGYKAVLQAADHLPKMFPMLMTAAGTLTAAKVFVIGAGVAGLQAIASARRLGAIVHAYDVRPAVKEQVESLGAKFVEMPLDTAGAEGAGGYAKQLGEEFYQKQRALMAQVVATSDVCITTAAIPGKQSPLLITADAVRGMAPGSVIVDLAAERGGNCELTKADQVVVEGGVTILGPTNLPSEVPTHASQMYAKNVSNFLRLITRDGRLDLNLEDEVVRDTLVAHRGHVVCARLRELLGLEPLQTPPPGSPPVSHLAGNKEAGGA
jgi:proton-translocating NAD(P)+ transhydrogenase subunit alpha